MTSLESYSFLWDGTQPGWVILRINRQAISIEVCFAIGGPTLREVAAMRKAVPSFSAMPPSDAFAALKGRSRVNLGSFEGRVARRLCESCRMHGLVVEQAVADRSGQIPFNEISNQSLVIEDDLLAERICQRAIAQGIRVKHVEA